ncbi:winged helix-turn-helix transcriptional regulator [Amycolatopsis rhizosphaerae]|uniref:Winged helix-turn-helix transcriptional regulator n=1 Tax=Amycolatopsis rhizosphaerae TaxID=2053003 RepID=A0A558CPL7_9PSEU|nr:winged helix-turn-helix domain-containing protein [Amycolatopsis rhizosphaerae]TVT50720.1 winged helix-turn-helix transcriptional regulator [Amycolatopsis rhizosphaerae]
MASLDPDDPRAPYLQVASGLRAAIRAGEYSPGAQLPSYQELADSWGVAINTAKSAVTLLRDEGLVVTRHGKGSFVRTQPAEAEPASRGDDDRLWQAIAEIRRRLGEIERRLGQNQS